MKAGGMEGILAVTVKQITEVKTCEFPLRMRINLLPFLGSLYSSCQRNASTLKKKLCYYVVGHLTCKDRYQEHQNKLAQLKRSEARAQEKEWLSELEGPWS